VTLADRFSEAPVPQGPAPRRVRSSAMTGFEPGVRVGPNGEQVITTPDLVEMLGDESAWREAVESLGVTVPAGWAVRLVEMRHDPAAWTREDSSQEKAVTRPVWRYRFRVEPAGPSPADIEDLIALVRETPAADRPEGADNIGAFVVAIGDTQFGKVDGDGLEGTIRRVLESTEAAVERFNDLADRGKTPEVVYICWLGDCIEGFVSQGGGNAWRTPTTLTEQVRIARRLMLHMIDQFRALAPRVVLLSIPGNHDETVRFGKQTTRYDDSWAIEAAVAVSDAMELNPDSYGHCTVKVPGRDELTLTVDMAGTIVGLAHGHQMRAGKAHEWWAGQAHGLQPIGEATLLLTAHFHHLVVEQPGAKTWIQIPALESESTWWRHLKGQVAPHGVVTLLVGSGGWSDLQVV
jgi:hypothetical protein